MIVPKSNGLDCDIAVVGGGPVGLLVAYLCADTGLDVVVCEAAPEIAQDLRATSFHPPTLDMLAPSGITAELIGRGMICPNWQVRMHPGGERAVFEVEVIADETNHPFRLQCEQWKLSEALAARLSSHQHAMVLMSARAIALFQDEACATVTVERPGGEAEKITAQYVVGADGWQSSVREWIGIPFEGVTLPETTLVVTTTFPFEEHIEGLSMVTSCWTAESHVAMLRLPDLWRLALYPDEAIPLDEQASPASVEAILAELAPADDHHVQKIWPYRVNQRCASTYRVGRVAIAGDAAHVNSPAGGLGLNAGIHDAFELSETLITMIRDGGSSDLLDRYDRRRRPLAQEILAQAKANRDRMRQRTPEDRRKSLEDLQAIAADRDRLKAFVMRASMIDGLRRHQSIN